MSTRAERAQAVAMLTALARAADATAKVYRQSLEAEALAELERDGTAPSWRIPGLGTVPLSLTADRVDVSDHVALLKWVQDRHPAQIKVVPRVEIVQPAFIGHLMKACEHVGEGAMVDPSSGEVVPGLRFVAGGKPAGISVKPNAAERERLASVASKLLEQSGLPALEAAPQGGAA